MEWFLKRNLKHQPPSVLRDLSVFEPRHWRYRQVCTPPGTGAWEHYTPIRERVQEGRKRMEQRWILVEERLPEERDSIFAKWKGTAKWNPAMFEKTSDEVLVTISDEGGKRTTRTAHTLDGKWSCDLLKANASYKVIAWMPLPEPYRDDAEEQKIKNDGADMKENKALELLKSSKRQNNMVGILPGSDIGDTIIKALEEVQQYRALGTPEELQIMKEHGGFTGV